LKVIEHDRKWVCNDCGSEKLMEKAWVFINHEISINENLYVKYDDEAGEEYWCDDCNDEAMPIPFEDYKEKEDEE
jgi:DNA-directed RNA polymerase subunit RPC12/RpoP